MTAAGTRGAQTLDQYLTHWLAEVVRPATEPATHSFYETMVRRYITPVLGTRHLEDLQTRDVQDWLDQLARTCQCCAHGKDARRPAARRRCCGAGRCCGDYPGHRTIQAASGTLRAALNHARRSNLISRNAASYVTLPGAPRPPRAGVTWTLDEASAFLASARADGDPLYPAYLLMLVTGLRRGEVLGLAWPSMDLSDARLNADWMLQRISGELLHKRVGPGKGYGAADTVLLPAAGVTALRTHRKQQAVTRKQAGDRWQDSDLVFTTRWGRPVEPANLNRSFDTRCTAAGVPRLRLRDTRSTCAALLAELGVNPMVIMRILRHAAVPASMAAAFARVSEEDIRAALSRLSSILGGAQSGAEAQR